MKLDFYLKRFPELGNDELYEILKLRQSVFILEQKALFEDIDDLDKDAYHLSSRNSGSLLAYARFYEKKKGIELGRIIIEKGHRGSGLSSQLIEYCLYQIENHFPGRDITIEAIGSLEELYNSFGFKRNAEPFMDCGWKMQPMILKK